MNFGPEYHKIQGVFKRTKNGVIIPWDYSLPEFGLLENTEWIWTEKVDGTNIRLHWDGSNVTIGGRTNKAQLPADLVKVLETWTKGDFGPEFWKERFSENRDEASVTLYGEGYGAGIQKVGNSYRSDKGFILFDIKVDKYWLERDAVEEIAKSFGFDVVPVAFYGTLMDCITDVSKMAQSVHLGEWWHSPRDPFSQINLPHNKAFIEGYVGTPVVQLFNRYGERIITKVKLKDWFDYYEKTTPKVAHGS